MNNEIHERIRHLRKSAKITQAEMSKRLGISIVQYSKMEKMGNFPCEKVKEISKILDVNILKILYDALEYKSLQERGWFIEMVNDYTAPYVFIREENEFAKKYYESLKKSNSEK